MRILMTAKFPNEPFNSMIREGRVEEIMDEIMENQRPETAYFTEINGQRGCIALFNMNDQSQLPGLAEPYFLNFNAECHFSVAMTVEDLKKANLNEIGKKWEKFTYQKSQYNPVHS
jgi:hypothetical protein